MLDKVGTSELLNQVASLYYMHRSRDLIYRKWLLMSRMNRGGALRLLAGYVVFSLDGRGGAGKCYVLKGRQGKVTRTKLGFSKSCEVHQRGQGTLEGLSGRCGRCGRGGRGGRDDAMEMVSVVNKSGSCGRVVRGGGQSEGHVCEQEKVPGC